MVKYLSGLENNSFTHSYSNIFALSDFIDFCAVTYLHTYRISILEGV